MSNVALVIGASGVTGGPMAEQLLLAGWKVYGVSRRVPQLTAGPLAQFRHVAADLADADVTAAALAQCTDVTHVYYNANDARSDVRLLMIRNVIDAIDAVAPDFTNIHLLQGLKYNGSHLGPFKTPAKESDARVPGADFYYSEEDHVLCKQRSKRWTWTAVRPSGVCGYAYGNPLNIAAVLAVYGAIVRELGQPFAFPGTPACFHALREVIDADLLARSAIWVSTHKECANQAYNVSNGDIFRWEHLWPTLARYFGLEPGGPENYTLAEFLADKQPLWEAMSRKYRLAAFPFEYAPTWLRGSFTYPSSRLATEYDFISDTLKIRRRGFNEVIDSECMFLRLFRRYRDLKMIP